jgi:cytochrome c oxidase cbb3-type subunit 3
MKKNTRWHGGLPAAIGFSILSSIRRVESRRSVVCALAIFALLAACKREQRPFNSQPMSGAEKQLQVSDLVPGPAHAPTAPVKNFYEVNAWGVAEGKRLYEFYNCVGCHAHGGGGMGPPLMDIKWIYGSNPEQVFATIVQGRPNGMPAFRGKIAEEQVWQLVAYVRSLGGLTSSGVEPARDDHMKSAPPENSLPAQTPVNANPPKDHP